MDKLTICDVYSCVYAVRKRIPKDRWMEIRTIECYVEIGKITPIDAICRIMEIAKQNDIT